MIDLEREEARLLAATGLDSQSLLAGLPWGENFARARVRYTTLCALPATPAVVLERDKLDSFFSFAYGAEGLVARAATLRALRDRLARLTSLLPRVAGDRVALSRLRREALILRTFCRGRLQVLPEGERPAKPGAARRRPEPSEPALHRALKGLCRALEVCADFSAEASALESDGKLAPALFGAVADAGFLAEEATRRPLLAAASFLLSRATTVLQQRSESRATANALVDSYLDTLRRELWEAIEEQLLAAPGAVTLQAIEAADVQLEGMVTTLANRALAAAPRLQLMGALFALSATARAAQAADEAAFAADASLASLAEALAADAGELA